MKKRVLILSAIFMACSIIFISLLFTKRSEDNASKSITNTYISANRKYLDVKLKSEKIHLFNNVPHRLINSGDSLIILVDTSIFLFSGDLSGKSEIKLPLSGGPGNFYTYKNKGIIAGLNVTSRQQYVLENGKLATSSGEGYYMNAIFLGNHFYSLRFVPNGNNADVLIDSWNYNTGERRILMKLNDFLQKEIVHCKECFEDVLEGNFFYINDTTAGLYFYRGGYFLTISRDSFLLKKTTVEISFIKFREKKGEFLNGLTAFQCEPVDDVWVQQSACADEEKIYILSGVIEKGKKDRCIDVYDSQSLSYLYSFFPPPYKDAQASEILVVNDYLIVVYDNGIVVSYYNTSSN